MGKGNLKVEVGKSPKPQPARHSSWAGGFAWKRTHGAPRFQRVHPTQRRPPPRPQPPQPLPPTVDIGVIWADKLPGNVPPFSKKKHQEKGGEKKPSIHHPPPLFLPETRIGVAPPVPPVSAGEAALEGPGETKEQEACGGRPKIPLNWALNHPWRFAS